jgi:Tol biopolymer transport system component
MRKSLLLLMIALACAACSTGSTESTSQQSTLTSTPSETTLPTATATITATPTVIPTLTATTPPTATILPTATTPSTATVIPSITPTPYNTPLPISRIERGEFVDAPVADIIRSGINRPHVAFINSNDSETITSLATAQPNTDRAILYYVDPTNRTNIYPVYEWNAELLQGNEIYLASNGRAIAFMLNDRAGSDQGLWVLDLSIGLSARIWATESLAVRGIFSEPAWSPDSEKLAVTLETGYNTDIFTFDLTSFSWQGLVRDGSFNFWPSWSPDGRYLAFVSDRETCPTWEANVPGACKPDEQPTPTGGHVYILALESGVVTRVSQEETREQPYWVNASTLAFSGGDDFDLLNPSRTLWTVSVTNMEAQVVGEDNMALKLNETWSPDGQQVIFQNASGSQTNTVITSRNGQRLATLDQISLARYGLAASWSADGQRLAVGGTGGQCPLPLRVFNDNFIAVSTPSQPTSVCNPTYSPDGQYLAYTGINTERRTSDGRRDIYVSSADGFSPANLTIDLRGQMTFLGWVGE